ncbi:MAG: hypothetical protein AVDCRST_MAG88-1834, partial [uncultured Thermomicrobiales bacterium]
MELAYAVTSALQTRGGLRPVLAPYSTGRGTFTCRHGGYAVAVFPFIGDATPFDVGLSDEGLAQAATLVAAVHRSSPALTGL